MGEYFYDKLEEAEARIPSKEYMSGKGLMTPFSNTVSGPRKIMAQTQREHAFPLINGEKAYNETGYEIRFGDRSSSITKTDTDYNVVAKISKFSFSPDHHYWLILEDKKNKRLDFVERISYQYITEEYGFLYNNQYLDNTKVGQIIPKNTIVQKSLAFDEYNNRKDGVNLTQVYLSLDENTEDSIVISESAAKKMRSPLIKPVEIMINENNIPLNLYGDDKIHKCIPDIGEDIKDSILIGLRKEKKEEMPFSESANRLRQAMISDEKKLLTGKVIDINIYCNNPSNLNMYYNSQLKMYYNELQRYSNEIVMAITPFVAQGYTLDYELETLYANSKRVLNKDEYIDKRIFSNIMLQIIVLEENEVKEGDKITNRYGGKGVISKIVPDHLMPKYGPKQIPIDIICNPFGVYNRENGGQLLEFSINHVARCIVDYIKDPNNKVTMDKAYNMIFEFYKLVSPIQGQELYDTIKHFTKEQKAFYLNSVITDGIIQTSIKPMSESCNIDTIRALYNTFSFATHEDLYVPQEDSNGNIRFIKARRKVIAASEYILRLKQFAEEKFSANNLSSTNISGFNSKSKANKNFLELHSNTPIRFGNMEMNNLNHCGVEEVVETLMIHSTSPTARRSVKQMFTCDPYNINIKLDSQAKSRGAEKINAYLKTIGRKLVFMKVPKKKIRMAIEPFSFDKAPVVKPIYEVPKDTNFDELYKVIDKKLKDKNRINPFRFMCGDNERRMERVRNNKEAYEEANMPKDKLFEKYRKLKEQEEDIR